MQSRAIVSAAAIVAAFIVSACAPRAANRAYQTSPSFFFPADLPLLDEPETEFAAAPQHVS